MAQIGECKCSKQSLQKQVNSDFSYSNIVSGSKVYDGCINLFFKNDCIALLDKYNADKIKQAISERKD